METSPTLSIEHRITRLTQEAAEAAKRVEQLDMLMQTNDIVGYKRAMKDHKKILHRDSMRSAKLYLSRNPHVGRTEYSLKQWKNYLNKEQNKIAVEWEVFGNVIGGESKYYYDDDSFAVQKSKIIIGEEWTDGNKGIGIESWRSTLVARQRALTAEKIAYELRDSDAQDVSYNTLVGTRMIKDEFQHQQQMMETVKRAQSSIENVDGFFDKFKKKSKYALDLHLIVKKEYQTFWPRRYRKWALHWAGEQERKDSIGFSHSRSLQNYLKINDFETTIPSSTSARILNDLGIYKKIGASGKFGDFFLDNLAAVNLNVTLKRWNLQQQRAENEARLVVIEALKLEDEKEDRAVGKAIRRTTDKGIEIIGIMESELNDAQTNLVTLQKYNNRLASTLARSGVAPPPLPPLPPFTDFTQTKFVIKTAEKVSKKLESLARNADIAGDNVAAGFLRDIRNGGLKKTLKNVVVEKRNSLSQKKNTLFDAIFKRRQSIEGSDIEDSDDFPEFDAAQIQGSIGGHATDFDMNVLISEVEKILHQVVVGQLIFTGETLINPLENANIGEKIDLAKTEQDILLNVDKLESLAREHGTSNRSIKRMKKAITALGSATPLTALLPIPSFILRPILKYSLRHTEARTKKMIRRFFKKRQKSGKKRRFMRKLKKLNLVEGHCEMCNEPTSLACGECMNVFYCGEECQSKDSDLHSEYCMDACDMCSGTKTVGGCECGETRFCNEDCYDEWEENVKNEIKCCGSIETAGNELDIDFDDMSSESLYTEAYFALDQVADDETEMFDLNKIGDKVETRNWLKRLYLDAEEGKDDQAGEKSQRRAQRKDTFEPMK